MSLSMYAAVMVDAGYSGTPQLRKLGIVDGANLAVIDAPTDWQFDSPLPSGVVLVSARASADVVLAFIREPTRLTRLPRLGQQIFPAGALWIAWPRKAAGHVSEVTENLIRDSALALGLVDVKVAAINTDWSGLKLVWRKELRTRHRPL